MGKVVALILTFLLALPSYAAKKAVIVKINVEPKEAVIYVDNNLVGYGYGVFARPQSKNQVAIIRIECDGYITVNSKFYGEDKRNSLSFRLMQDDFECGTSPSRFVNEYLTVDIAPAYYDTMEDGRVDVSAAWKLLDQILLNYYLEIETKDFLGGYVQTSWDYKKFVMSDKIIRTKVVVRDATTSDRVVFQIKIVSEVANAMSARRGEFYETERIPKDKELMLEEILARLGEIKINNIQYEENKNNFVFHCDYCGF